MTFLSILFHLIQTWWTLTVSEPLTIHFMYGYLSKNMQIRPVKHSAEYPVRPGIVLVEESLIGHSVGHEPHSQKKEEEEDVLHLEEARTEQR